MTPLLPTSDERDFARFLDRDDAAALGRVFERQSPALRTLARHLAADPGSADDLVQQTFLTALEKRATWDRSRPLIPWLTGILALHARAARGRAARSRERVLSSPNTDSHGSDPTLVVTAASDPTRVGPLADAIGRERAAAFEALLASLPARESDVLGPHLVEGLSASAIGARLGLTANAVHQRVHRAVRRIARRLPPALAPSVVAVGGATNDSLPLFTLANERSGVASGSSLGRARTRSRATLSHGTWPVFGALTPWLWSMAGITAAAVIYAGVADGHPFGSSTVQLGTSTPFEQGREGAHASLVRAQPTELVGVPSPRRAVHDANGVLAGESNDTLTDTGDASTVESSVHRLRVTCLVQSTADSRVLAGASAWLRPVGGLSADATLLARADAPASESNRPLGFTFELDETDLTRLEIRASGHLSWRAAEERQFLAAQLRGDFSLSEDGKSAFFNPFLHSAGTVSGRVVDAGGAPVAEAELFVIGAYARDGVPDSDAVLARSGADGRFCLVDAVREDLGQDDHPAVALVAMSAPGGGPTQIGWTTLRGQEELIVQLGLPCRIEATVIDTDGRPAVGAVIVADPCGGPWWRSSTNARGTSRLVQWPARWRDVFEATVDPSGRADFAALPTLPENELGLYDGARLAMHGAACGLFELRAASEAWVTVERGRAYTALPVRRSGQLVPALSVEHSGVAELVLPSPTVLLKAADKSLTEQN